MAQAQLPDSIGNTARFLGVQTGRATGFNGTEAARPGADPSQDQERRGAVLPAFVDVGAPGLLTDGVQAQASLEGLQILVVRPGDRLDLQPVRLRLDGDAGRTG